MAAMSTTLHEYSRNGDRRTSVLAGHTTQKPKVFVCNRKVPSGNQTVSEASAVVSFATEDADGIVIPQRQSFSVYVRSPIQGDTADLTAALAVFRDFIASDEFTTFASTAQYPAEG